MCAYVSMHVCIRVEMWCGYIGTRMQTWGPEVDIHNHLPLIFQLIHWEVGGSPSQTQSLLMTRLVIRQLSLETSFRGRITGRLSHSPSRDLRVLKSVCALTTDHLSSPSSSFPLQHFYLYCLACAVLVELQLRRKHQRVNSPLCSWSQQECCFLTTKCDASFVFLCVWALDPTREVSSLMSDVLGWVRFT